MRVRQKKSWILTQHRNYLDSFTPFEVEASDQDISSPGDWTLRRLDAVQRVWRSNEASHL